MIRTLQLLTSTRKVNLKMPRVNPLLMNKANQLLPQRSRFNKQRMVDMLRLLKVKNHKLKSKSKKLVMLSKQKIKELRIFQLLSLTRKVNLKITKAKLL